MAEPTNEMLGTMEPYAVSVNLPKKHTGQQHVHSKTPIPSVTY